MNDPPSVADPAIARQRPFASPPTDRSLEVRTDGIGAAQEPNRLRSPAPVRQLPPSAPIGSRPGALPHEQNNQQYDRGPLHSDGQAGAHPENAKQLTSCLCGQLLHLHPEGGAPRRWAMPLLRLPLHFDPEGRAPRRWAMPLLCLVHFPIVTHCDVGLHYIRRNIGRAGALTGQRSFTGQGSACGIVGSCRGFTRWRLPEKSRPGARGSSRRFQRCWCPMSAACPPGRRRGVRSGWHGRVGRRVWRRRCR